MSVENSTTTTQGSAKGVMSPVMSAKMPQHANHASTATFSPIINAWMNALLRPMLILPKTVTPATAAALTAQIHPILAQHVPITHLSMTISAKLNALITTIPKAMSASSVM
jgi:hypothetical protein